MDTCQGTASKILSATVSEKAGGWFVCTQVEEEIPDPEPAPGVPVRVDLGTPTLATCSDATSYENPKVLQKAHKNLRRLQGKLSRQDKGSSNREKTRKKIAKLHFRIANIRPDALHKATSGIVAKTKPCPQRPSMVVLEDLNVNGMLKNHRLAPAHRGCGNAGVWAAIGLQDSLVWLADCIGRPVVSVEQEV